MLESDFQTEIIEQGSANQYGCERVDDDTHWTDIFMPLKTEYDDTDTNPSGDEVNQLRPTGSIVFATWSTHINPKSFLNKLV